MSGPPRFHRNDGDSDQRLGTIEEYLSRTEEYQRSRDEAVNRGILELEQRVSKLEAWKVDVLLFIGMSKVKWAFVMFASAGVASILTALLTRMLGV